MSCKLRILYGFFVMIQKQFFAYFSSFPRRSNISIRKTFEKIRKSYSFSENDLKYEITLANSLFWRESKLPISLEQFYLLQLLEKLRLVVTGSCNSSHRQQVWIKGGQRGQLPRTHRWKGAPRDEIFLFQIKYSFEKIRDSEVIQGYNPILYSYVALSIKGPQQQLISLQV